MFGGMSGNLMFLYLIRHGPAADRLPQDEADDDLRRPLTEEGRKKTKRAARGMAALLPAPDIIVTSSALRSVQTAGVISAVWRCRDIRCQPALNPGAGMAAYVSVLNEITDDEGSPEEMRLAMVTHQPELGDFLGHLLESNIRLGEDGRFLLQPAAFTPFELKKSSLVVVEVTKEKASLQAFFSPGMLRRIARM